LEVAKLHKSWGWWKGIKWIGAHQLSTWFSNILARHSG